MPLPSPSCCPSSSSCWEATCSLEPPAAAAARAAAANAAAGAAGLLPAVAGFALGLPAGCVGAVFWLAPAGHQKVAAARRDGLAGFQPQSRAIMTATKHRPPGWDGDTRASSRCPPSATAAAAKPAGSPRTLLGPLSCLGLLGSVLSHRIPHPLGGGPLDPLQLRHSCPGHVARHVEPPGVGGAARGSLLAGGCQDVEAPVQVGALGVRQVQLAQAAAWGELLAAEGGGGRKGSSASSMHAVRAERQLTRQPRLGMQQRAAHCSSRQQFGLLRVHPPPPPHHSMPSSSSHSMPAAEVGSGASPAVLSSTARANGRGHAVSLP